MARKNTYACTACKKTFSRKYNAERHNKIVHDEMAIVYNKETDWRSNIKKPYVVSPNLKDQTIKSISSSTSPKSSLSTPKIDKDYPNNPTSNQNFNKRLKDLYKDELDLDINENKDDEFVLKIIGKISPYIDTLDNLLSSRYPDNNIRINILSFTLFSSLTTSNPINFIKEQINFFRSVIAMRRAVTLASHYYNVEPKQARENLKELVLSAPYSKNKFQQQNKDRYF
jgi:hypothetical protein